MIDVDAYEQQQMLNAIINAQVDALALSINPPIILTRYQAVGLWVSRFFPSWRKYYFWTY